MSIVTCYGDSGAPLWITKKGENSDKNILVGVVVGAHDGRIEKYFQPQCTSKIGSAYKLTDNILSWIRKNMKRYDGDSKNE